MNESKTVVLSFFLENGIGNIPPDFGHVKSAPGSDSDSRRTWCAE
jgi:hypothetical protein